MPASLIGASRGLRGGKSLTRKGAGRCLRCLHVSEEHMRACHHHKDGNADCQDARCSESKACPEQPAARQATLTSGANWAAQPLSLMHLNFACMYHSLIRCCIVCQSDMKASQWGRLQQGWQILCLECL